jgi:hypothetical protein
MKHWSLWSESFQVEVKVCKSDQSWLRKPLINLQLPADYYRDKLAKFRMRKLKEGPHFAKFRLLQSERTNCNLLERTN